MVRSVCVSGVEARFQEKKVLKDINFSLERGEIGCLLGASGSGKTTMLRSLAGFHDLEGGTIAFNDHIVSKKGYALAPEKRHVGMVFQDFSLFAHLNVRENIDFGMKGWSANERKQRIARLLDRFGMKDLEHRYMHELSGGQQQRVAVMRAIAPRPSLLLMDEPLSRLDEPLRQLLAVEIRDILKQEKLTTLWVTHHQNEAFAVSDKLGVMDSGRIHQWGMPFDVYHEPANALVGAFLGQSKILNVRIGDGCVHSALGTLVGDIPDGFEKEEEALLLLRPEHIIHNDDSSLSFPIKHRVFRGSDYLATLELSDGTEVFSQVACQDNHRVGEILPVRLNIPSLLLFKKNANRNLSCV